jgi:hypothetical protein
MDKLQGHNTQQTAKQRATRRSVQRKKITKRKLFKIADLAIKKWTTGAKRFSTLKTEFDQPIKILRAIHRQKLNDNSLSAQLLEEINLLLALNLSSVNQSSLNMDQESNNSAVTDDFSLFKAQKAIAWLTCLESQHHLKECLDVYELKQAEYENNHLLNCYDYFLDKFIIFI